MLLRSRKLMTYALGTAIVLSLGACAGTGEDPVGLSYPKLGAIKRIKDKLLSKDEQDAAIRDLSKEQASQRDSAVDDIEKR
jgi:hypothetical protein